MWSTKDERRSWENKFVNVFVSPFWKVKEEQSFVVSIVQLLCLFSCLFYFV